MQPIERYAGREMMSAMFHDSEQKRPKRCWEDHPCRTSEPAHSPLAFRFIRIPFDQRMCMVKKDDERHKAIPDQKWRKHARDDADAWVVTKPGADAHDTENLQCQKTDNEGSIEPKKLAYAREEKWPRNEQAS